MDTKVCGLIDAACTGVRTSGPKSPAYGSTLQEEAMELTLGKGVKVRERRKAAHVLEPLS
eukprot:3939091-Rhodomonas_salina.1